MSVLFEKTNIKSMELENRLVRSATHEGMADSDGFPTQALFKLYERLARGGVGLIISGYAFVSRDGISPFIGMQGIDSDDHIPRYRELVNIVHQNGAKIAMQNESFRGKDYQAATVYACLQFEECQENQRQVKNTRLCSRWGSGTEDHVGNSRKGLS